MTDPGVRHVSANYAWTNYLRLVCATEMQVA